MKLLRTHLQCDLYFLILIHSGQIIHYNGTAWNETSLVSKQMIIFLYEKAWNIKK